MDRPIIIPFGGDALDWVEYADHLEAENAKLREAAQIVVDRMRGSGGINPDAADALLELAALSKENSDD